MPTSLFGAPRIENRRLYSNQYTIVPNNNTGVRTKVGQCDRIKFHSTGELAESVKAAMPSVAATVHEINFANVLRY